MAESIQAIRRRLEQRDAQSEQLVRQQISGLDTNYNNGITALDAEKEQEFGNITTQANANGQAFTGAGIFNQRQYLGTKYLPGRQQLLSERENNRFKLQGTLADYARQRSQDAEEVRNGQLRDDRETAIARQKLALEQQRIAASRMSAASRGGGGGRSAGRAQDPLKGYSIKRDGGGGVQFVGPRGALTAQQYASATGTTV